MICNPHTFLYAEYITLPDPLNGEPFIQMPNTKVDELGPFLANAQNCPKTGLHNPLKNPERYVMWGEIMHECGHELSKPATMEFFAKLVQRVMPKHHKEVCAHNAHTHSLPPMQQSAPNLYIYCSIIVRRFTRSK